MALDKSMFLLLLLLLYTSRSGLLIYREAAADRFEMNVREFTNTQTLLRFKSFQVAAAAAAAEAERETSGGIVFHDESSSDRCKTIGRYIQSAASSS